MIATFEFIQKTVKEEPGNHIKIGRENAKVLQLHVEGIGMAEAIKNCEHFVNPDIYKIQKLYAVSNVDMFTRILQPEDMVFMARGGSSHFRLTETDEAMMHELLANVEHGMNLRKWVQIFALSAYRADPASVIFMEVDPVNVTPSGMNMPRAYPTYKSIFSIHNYTPNGRHLEYICFQLNVGEALSFGISDAELKGQAHHKETNYFRFVDDVKDVIVKKDGDNVNLVGQDNITQKNPIKNSWTKTPGFVVSNIIKYKQPFVFLSPLQPVVELADTFLQDRSIRNLQKQFHGFAKAVEPLLQCTKCSGNKVVNGEPCKACTPPGGEPTGYKLNTKIADVARFPLEILEKGSFDLQKIFGYIAPPITTWNKQDENLEDIEQLIEMTHYGTVRMKRPKVGDGGGDAITATESSSNEAPKEARLNQVADWAEKTESMIAWFIGKYWFQDKFMEASIAYGRDYILKTADQLMAQYQTLCTKGAPDFSKDEALEKYYQAKYVNNQVMLHKYLKMLNVEPFPHDSVSNIEASSVVPFEDKLAKRYFGEWADTIQDGYWLKKSAKDLIAELKLYITGKGITAPAPKPNPAMN